MSIALLFLISMFCSTQISSRYYWQALASKRMICVSSTSRGRFQVASAAKDKNALRLPVCWGSQEAISNEWLTRLFACSQRVVFC